MQLQGQSLGSCALFDEVSPMSLERAGYRSHKTGALAGAALNDGGVCISIERMLARSSPRVRQYLNGMSDELRRKMLDGVRRRLMKDDRLVLLPRDNEQPLIAHLDTGGGGSPADRALSLTDLHDFPVPHEDALRLIYDLTPAEARLAQAITRGDSLEEIAMSLGIKMPTARTQLASIFAKTGTRRQAKLVAILNRLALLVG
jgi:DNA-binding CsgD family transcriptional regulator